MGLNALFEGWINIPHSYAIVLCFQLIFLYKRNQNVPEDSRINIYIKETKYFFDKWNHLNLNVHKIYPKEYADILDKIIKGSTPEVLKDLKPDLIYRISFPYNIFLGTTTEEIKIPKCIFYTSEFRTLDNTYFTDKGYLILDKERFVEYNDKKDKLIIEIEPNEIKKKIRVFKNLYFTGPSSWSTNGLKDFGNIPETRNRIITHGVDTNLFYKSSEERSRLRSRFNIADDDFVMLNMGAFTSNKGILLLLQLIYIFVSELKLGNVKIIFKGLQDLYQSQEMLGSYIDQLSNFIPKEKFEELISNGNIKFMTETLTFDNMRSMYNMCDVYVSPYIAEGFNITPLEALACGTHIVVPETGSTKDYIDDIEKECPTFIHKIKSTVVSNAENKYYNNIDFNSLLNTVYLMILKKNPSCSENDYKDLVGFLEKNYSWSHVADLLHSYFVDIIDIVANSKESCNK